MKAKWRNGLIAGVAMAAVVVGAYCLIRQTAKHDVLETCAPLERDASVELVYEGTYLSLHHGVLVGYRVVGLTELSAAYWYLIPWRDVELTK